MGLSSEISRDALIKEEEKCFHVYHATKQILEPSKAASSTTRTTSTLANMPHAGDSTAFVYMPVACTPVPTSLSST